MILDFGCWMLDEGVAFGDDLNKMALQCKAHRNHSPFTTHHSPFRGMAIPRYKYYPLPTTYYLLHETRGVSC